MKQDSKRKSPGINIGVVIGITIGMFGLLLVLVMGMFLLFALVSMVSFTFGVLELLIFIRTKNHSFLVLALFLFGCASLSTATVLFGFQMTNLILISMSIIVVILFIWVLFLLFTRKLKWRSREILELAALPVEETFAGFTQRPFPVGQVSRPGTTVINFASFIHKKLIAIPYIENGSVVLSVNSKLARQIGLLTDYLDTTWVRFDKDGNVSVYISRADYNMYKDSLSFDQLCSSLGNLFIEFFDQFVAGEEQQILSRLNFS